MSSCRLGGTGCRYLLSPWSVPFGVPGDTTANFVRSDTPGAGKVRCAGIDGTAGGGDRGTVVDASDSFENDCDENGGGEAGGIAGDIVEVIDSFENEADECADEEKGEEYEDVDAIDLDPADLDFLPQGIDIEKVTRGRGRWRRGGAFMSALAERRRMNFFLG